MLWHGRPYGCSSWLPEDIKMIICGMEEKNVVAYGCLPSPTSTVQNVLTSESWKSLNSMKQHVLTCFSNYLNNLFT